MNLLSAKFIKKVSIPLFLYKNWWIVYFDHLRLLPKKEIVLKLRNGVKLHLCAVQSEGLIVNSIWGEHSYIPKGFAIGKKDIVVDIGAHKGVFSIYASYLASQGNVYAFEPYSENYAFLQKNIETNRRKNVVTEQVAVSSKPGALKLYITPGYSAGISIIKSKHMQGKIEVIEVKSLSLKDIFSKHKLKKIDFLKIDCEGAEYEIILNSPSSVLGRVKQISMEYHQVKNLHVETLVKHLTKEGFIVSVEPIDNVIGMLYAKRENKE